MMKPMLEATLNRLGVTQLAAVAIGDRLTAGQGELLRVHSPIDGAELARFHAALPGDVEHAAAAAQAAFLEWRSVPAPRRGDVVRRIGERLRAHKTDLALLVTLSPERIILGGGVMDHPALLPMTRTEVQRLLNQYVQSPAVLQHIDEYLVAPGLGNRSGVLGALALAQQAHAAATSAV